MVEVPPCAEIVRSVKAGEPAGLGHLYTICTVNLAEVLRLTLGWRFRFSGMDGLHDTFIAAVEAIQGGKLRESEALIGYLVGIANQKRMVHDKRYFCHARLLPALVQRTLLRGKSENVEDRMCLGADVEAILRLLNARERAIVTMFYLDELSAAEVRSALGLTQTQFRNAKSRALGKIFVQRSSGNGAAKGRAVKCRCLRCKACRQRVRLQSAAAA